MWTLIWLVLGALIGVAAAQRKGFSTVAGLVGGLLLGHTMPGPASTKVYDRSELLPERRAALVAWADWLGRLQAPAVGRQVVAFKPLARNRR